MLRCAAEAQLVAVGIAVDRLADSVRVRLDLVGFQTSSSDRGHVPIEIVDEDRRDGLPCAIGVLDDVDRPLICRRPHCLRGVRGRTSPRQQLLVPPPGRVEVTHTKTREEVQRHTGGSRRAPASECPAARVRTLTIASTRAASAQRAIPSATGQSPARRPAAPSPAHEPVVAVDVVSSEHVGAIALEECSRRVGCADVLGPWLMAAAVSVVGGVDAC